MRHQDTDVHVQPASWRNFRADPWASSGGARPGRGDFSYQQFLQGRHNYGDLWLWPDLPIVYRLALSYVLFVGVSIVTAVTA